ncbi:MAG: hypothetical protein ACTSQZ_01820 [Candidatus Thorarchaeota archaeon]
MDEKVKVYKKRRWAKSDAPLSKAYKTRMCVSCKSKKTIILYYSDSSSTDNEGWGSRDWTREFKCLDCGNYFEIELSGYVRKHYTRCS